MGEVWIINLYSIVIISRNVSTIYLKHHTTLIIDRNISQFGRNLNQLKIKRKKGY